MKKLSWILGALTAAGLAGAASKLLRPPPGPEGSWKDVSAKPSPNGSQPG